MNPVPANPVQAVPAQAVPAQAVPVQAVPAQAVPVRADGARMLRGARNWWFLGANGAVARLREGHVTAGGALRPDAGRQLRELGLLGAAPLPRAYSLTVLTSTQCNLGCGYCFQNTGQDTGPGRGSRPPRIARARLTAPTITSILGFAERQMAAVGLDKVRIMLFGGEPLLNARGCVELLARAAGTLGPTSAWMISNATLLTGQLAGDLARLGLDHVQVTFDGDRPDHDRIRVRRAQGAGTFDTIVGNIARACQDTAIGFTLRVNVSQDTIGGVDSLIERLAARLDTSRCTLYFAPVGDVGVGFTNELLYTGELAARFGCWQRAALQAGFRVSRPRAGRPCATCGYRDGRYGAVVSADGTLASCWETAGRPDWQVGTVTEGYAPQAVTGQRWVGCQDLYRHSENEQARAAFRDAVDAALLDHLDETGRL